MVYEGLWKDNRRRYTEKTDTFTVLRTFGPDYKLILVGDATMSPYEVTYPGGSVEHFNPEAGDVWMRRLLTSPGLTPSGLIRSIRIVGAMCPRFKWCGS
jgi:uncharacterized protein with von Willebrand factor type A (vWA) domain